MNKVWVHQDVEWNTPQLIDVTRHDTPGGYREFIDVACIQFPPLLPYFECMHGVRVHRRKRCRPCEEMAAERGTPAIDLRFWFNEVGKQRMLIAPGRDSRRRSRGTIAARNARRRRLHRNVR